MIRVLPWAVALGAFFAILSCGSSSSGTVQVVWDRTVDFTEFETFSVVTREVIENNPDFPAPPDLPADAEAAIAQINALIIQAMGPTGLGYTYIPPEEVTPENQPDLWAGNVGSVTEEQGIVWECVGGWWWGYWGWYWDPCRWYYPRTVEFGVGSLLIPVASTSLAEPIFGGLAQGIVYDGGDNAELVAEAVAAIFAQWPIDQTGIATDGNGGTGGAGGAGGVGGSP